LLSKRLTSVSFVAAIVKVAATGARSTGVALTKNALGEVYLTMGRLDQAQQYLEEAAEIRRCRSFLSLFV